MKLVYAVFWLGQQREIYGTDSYYVLGELMSIFNTQKEAVECIKELHLRVNELCTIVPVYRGE